MPRGIARSANWFIVMTSETFFRIFARTVQCVSVQLAIWFFISSTGYAEEGDESDPGQSNATEEELKKPVVENVSTNVADPPYFMRNKRVIPDFVLRDKKAGKYFTGIPLIGYDPEQGFNYGLAVQRYFNGPRDSPYFTHAPYRKKVSIAAANSTEGATRVVLAYDQPYVKDTPWRIGAYVGFVKTERENYFGNDARSLDALSYPGSSRTYEKIEDYYDSQDQVINGTTYSHYNRYFRQDLIAAFNLEYDLLGGKLRPLVGFQVDFADIDDYTGKGSNGGTNAPTLLFTDQQNGRINGFEGGWNNLIRMGITYDTRDYEPNPTRGGGGSVTRSGRDGHYWF